MTTKTGLQAAISGALDAVLRQRGELATERHWADFEAAWAQLGYPNDPALKRRAFARLRPHLQAQDAKRAARVDLAADLARAESRDRLAAAGALGRRQGRELARREHAQALTAALDRRITAALERRRRLVPPGPIRLF